MKIHPITDKIFALHADIQSDDLFEGIWPIPYGVSLNSYLVKSEKVALIDLVRDWVGAPGELAGQLASIGLGLDDVDYLILNHLEPDHTGWLNEFRAINPNAEIISTAKGIDLLRSFYKIEDGLRVVKTGDRLELGDGFALDFFEAPNVHWPETMMTWAADGGVLFSCDAFGSFGALGDRVFDDQFSDEEHAFFESESLRYYSNIVASFGLFVKRAIDKVSGLDIQVVAPSHGMVWRQNPGEIIERYLRYANYLEGPREKEIAIVWGSMYGNTEKGLAAVIEGIEEEGVPYTIHRVPNEDASWVLSDAYKSEGLVVAMPTYEYKMFPPMAYVLDIFERKHVWYRKVLRIGSFGWVGGARKEYENKIAPLKWNSLEAVEWAGAADEDTLELLYERGRELARAVKEA
ncbi:MAG: FprA family A-type flavoprotein [Spirochaetia bacterium]|jgi:flavorubredoxin|nr:FprA family A-type flavoprotein [Spirochaetales bacterium]MDX9783433.1 FprA family A-type flavoprotein [Spirochaetia bacterium]